MKQMISKRVTIGMRAAMMLAVVMTMMFAMPQGALAQTKYKIETDGNCEVYYYDNFERIVVTEAEAGKKLSIWLKEDANPSSGKYFTGEYTLNGSSLGVAQWGAYNDEFTMPAKAVKIVALQANRKSITLDLTTTTPQEIPAGAALQFNIDERVTPDYEIGGYDMDNSGTNDLKYYDDGGDHAYVQRLEGADASGTITLTYSGPTDSYGSISFVFPPRTKIQLQSGWIILSGTEFTYTGQAIEPQVTVTDGGTDVTSYFDIAYQNNVFAGKSTDAKAPTVTVSAKSGQTKYQGSAQKTFTITPRVTTEGSRIAVIADPHVMPASLLTNPSNADWKTYLAGSRKLIDYSQTLLDQTVATLKSDRPELVLIVGDLTKDGEQASHNYLKGKLDELKAVGIPTLVIPGNHDLSSSDAKIYGATTTAAPTISQSDFAQLYQDYGYGPTSERESASSLTYACEPIDGLVVIGIDSGEEGQLPEATLTWVCNKAVAARTAGKQVIAMMHHPLIPHITGGEAFVSTVSVADYTTVRNRLADAGISVVFTGHFHTSDIARDWNGDKTLPIYDVTTGSLCSYPCDYRVVTLNDALTQMQIDTRSITSAGAPLGGGDQFTTSIAKTRLSGSVENILKPRLTAKLVASGTSQNLAAIAVNAIAPSLAQAYIYHAEGDEHKNSAAQSLLNNLNSLLESYPAYKAMASSMLEDKSNYGTDRVDQTNDRSLNASTEMVAKTIQSLEVTIAQGPFTYTGQAIEPAVTVTDGGTDVTSYFDVKYSNNTNAGKSTDAEAPTVTVKAKSGLAKYQGSVQETFTITPKPVTISGVKANDKVYDGNTTAEINIKGASIDGKFGNDEVNIGSGSAAFADANVGEDKSVTFSGFTLTGAQAGNYTLSAQPASVTGTIHRKALELVANAVTIKEGDAVPLTFTGSVKGFVAGENISGGDKLLFTLSDPSACTPGSYGITGTLNGSASGNYGQNYTFSNAAANATAFTINAKPDPVNPDPEQGGETVQLPGLPDGTFEFPDGEYMLADGSQLIIETDENGGRSFRKTADNANGTTTVIKIHTDAKGDKFASTTTVTDKDGKVIQTTEATKEKVTNPDGSVTVKEETIVTVTCSDGAKTTTENTKKTVTDKDGKETTTETIKETVTDKDGKVLETTDASKETVTNPDGTITTTQTTITTVKDTEGSVLETTETKIETLTDADGNVIETTETTTKEEGLKIDPNSEEVDQETGEIFCEPTMEQKENLKDVISGIGYSIYKNSAKTIKDITLMKKNALKGSKVKKIVVKNDTKASKFKLKGKKGKKVTVILSKKHPNNVKVSLKNNAIKFRSTMKLSSRGSSALDNETDPDDEYIESGDEIVWLEDCDLTLTFDTSEEDIIIDKIEATDCIEGDANNDGYVNAADLVEMINAKNGHASERFNLTNADIDRDGDITQEDIDAVVHLIMDHEFH